MIKPTLAPAPNFISYGAVLGVHDADTITVLRDLGHSVYFKTDFRLLGIDTPEISHQKSLADQRLHGEAARARLIELIGQTKMWWEEETPWGKIRQPMLVLKSTEPDKYGGRWLGEVWAPGGATQLQLQLVTEGYAREYNGDAKKPWDFTNYPKGTAK